MQEESSDQRVVEKKPRKRMKEIRKMILKQMEFYFSDSNLQKDRFIKKEMEKSKDGLVDLSIFLKFNRVKALTEDIKILARALSKSDLLQVTENGKYVRRVKPLSAPEDIDKRTVYIECLPRNVTHDWVNKIFSKCGEVAYVSLPRYQTTGDSKGFGFVEFQSEESANKACELLNNPPPDTVNRAGKFPKSNKTLNQLQKKTGIIVDTEELKEINKPTSPVKGEASTDDNIHTKSCKKHKKRRRCASESSVDYFSDEIPVFKKKKLDSPEVKPDTSTDSDLKTENKSESKEEDDNPDEEDEKDSKRKKRKRQRLSESSKSQEDDAADSVEEPEKKQKMSKTDVSTKCLDCEQESDKKVKEKRKKSDSEIHNETVEVKIPPAKSDQSPEKKKMKVSEKQESLPTQSEVNSSVLTKKADAPEKKSKKKEKRKRRKKHKEKDTTLPLLRVIPKQEWLQLRKEYLSLQKESMAVLKQKLKEVKTNENTGDVKNHKTVNGNLDVAPSKPGKKIEFQPGVIVYISSKVPMNRKQVKEQIASDIQVAYIDVLDDDLEGYIRCKNQESATKLASKKSDKYEFFVLTGDKEKEYWSKLLADQEAKLNSKNRSKKRGVQKLIAKAYKHNSGVMERKHILFED